MKSTFNPALLTARVLLSTKNTISPLTSTFYVTQTWSDSIFLNFLMKTQGFFGFLCFYYLCLNRKIGYCDSFTSPLLISTQNTVSVEPCVAGIINLHYDAITFLFMLLFLVLVIMGYGMYFFNKKRYNREHYPQFFIIENFIKNNPTTSQKFRVAGYNIVVGLGLVTLASVIYFISPTEAPAVLSTIETPVVSELSLVKELALKAAKPEVLMDKPHYNYRYNTLQKNLSFQINARGDMCYQNKHYVSELRYVNNLVEGSEYVGIRGGNKRHVDLVKEVKTFYTTLSSSPRDQHYLYQLNNACRIRGKYELLYLLQNYTNNDKNVNMVLYELLNMEFSDKPLNLNNSKDRHTIELMRLKDHWSGIYGLNNPHHVTPPSFMYKLR